MEVGCGSGGNLWMMAKEGFDTYGLDGSSVAIKMAESHLREKCGGTAHLNTGRFDDLPYDDSFFDVVVDVVSLQHIDLSTTEKAFKEIYRVLKPGGQFFSYRLSDGSCMYLNAQGTFLDSATVDNVYPHDLPLNNNEVMSFWSPTIARMYYESAGLKIREIEKNIRTYYNMKMQVEYLEIIAVKD